MPSIGSFMKITIIVLFGLVFHVVCLENHKKCFDIEEKRICYFIPNVSSVDWNTAWKTCRDLNASLPVIPSQKVQEMLSDYLRHHFYPFTSVWTAGRYIGSDEWRWLNGQAFTGTDKPSCTYNRPNCTHDTQAVLTQHLKYEARFPVNKYNYICRFSGVSCTNESQYSIPWKDGCLMWTDNDRQPLNKARNNCLKDGGDLATFIEDGDLQRLQKFSHMLTDTEYGYLVGLQRKWWIWNATDVQDIKYNMLNTYVNLEKHCLFINERTDWKSDSCADKKNVICQTVTDNNKSSSGMTDSKKSSSAVIGIVIGILAVVVIIVVVIIILVKKRAHVATAKVETEISRAKPYTVPPPKDTVDQFQDDNTYATIDSDDDRENLDYENDPNPKTGYINVEVGDHSAVYSDPVDFGASETGIYSEPYSNLPVPRNLGPSGDICADPIKPGKQHKKSDELASPIKIGPQGDIYTLPTSRN